MFINDAKKAVEKKINQKKGGEEFHIFIKTKFILEKNHKQELEQQKLLRVFQKTLETLLEFDGLKKIRLVYQFKKTSKRKKKKNKKQGKGFGDGFKFLYSLGKQWRNSMQ